MNKNAPQIVPGCADLLRHGRTERDDIFRGKTDDPLSQVGWEQMAVSIGTDSWDRVVSSPLSRCLGFATHLAEKQNIDLIVDDRLQEYDFGDWDGQTYDDVMAEQSFAVEAFFADPFNAPPPNGEDFTSFNHRVKSAWHEILDQYHLQHTLVIAHGGVIMTILADVLGVERLHGRIDMAYACRSQVRLDQLGQRPRLIFHK